MFKSLNPFKSASGAVASALQNRYTVPFLDPNHRSLLQLPVFRPPSSVLSHAEGSSYFCKNAFFSIIKTAESLTIDYSDMHGLIGWMGTPCSHIPQHPYSHTPTPPYHGMDRSYPHTLSRPDTLTLQRPQSSRSPCPPSSVFRPPSSVLRLPSSVHVHEQSKQR